MQEYSQLIFEYLAGNLNKKDQASLEALLQSDRELKRELDLQRDMIATLRAKGKAAMKNELKAAWQSLKKDLPEEEDHEKGRVVDMKKLKKFALRAAAGLAAAGIFLSHFGGTMGQSATSQQEEEQRRKKRKKH